MSNSSLRNAVIFGLCGGLLGFISRLTVVDLDLFHEMALIREALRVGFLPRVDVFSYVPTISPVVHHEWGTGAILYLVTVQFGLGANGLVFLKYLLTAFIALGCFFFATSQGASFFVFSLLALIGLCLGWAGFSTIRAQLFTLCFLIMLFFLIEEDRKGKAWALWAWLPVYLTWLNLHGGFVVGLGLLAVYTIEQLFIDFGAEKNFLRSLKMTKRHILFLIATCLLTIVNPYKTDYLSYIWNAVTLDRTPYIPEWRPLWEISWAQMLGWIISLGVVLYCMTKKKLRQMPGLLMIVATAWVSLWHYRHLSIYAIAWMCYTPFYVEKTSLGDSINGTFKRRPLLLIAFFVTIGILGIFYAVQNHFWKLRIPTTAKEHNEGVPVYPAGAVRYLGDIKFSGNIMVPYDVGAYVSWNLYPNARVSMDSRFEVAYPIKTLAENIIFYGAEEGWQKTLTKYPTDAILIPRWSKLEKVMGDVGIINGNSFTWNRVYVDDGYSLYMRSGQAKNYTFKDMRGEPITARFP